MYILIIDEHALPPLHSLLSRDGSVLATERERAGEKEGKKSKMVVRPVTATHCTFAFVRELSRALSGYSAVTSLGPWPVYPCPPSSWTKAFCRRATSFLLCISSLFSKPANSAQMRANKSLSVGRTFSNW